MDQNVPINEQPPVSIPDHELVRCIGRGSYGTVWLGRNSMGVYRAIKIVFRSSFHDRRPFDRELSGIRKFEPLSRSHEGFVDVLQVGLNEAEGYFYYVMELGDDEVRGQQINPESYVPRTLNKEITLNHKFSFQECLELGLALSLALAELHKHGLVHRDVKPSNIIFVNGVPKLADIGLVAEASEARSYVGTEGFIPPEGPGTPQADVYSLGKVLYEISTGKDRNEFPELPTLLDEFSEPEKFLELNEIILHACSNDIKTRYQSVWDLHAHLVVLANGQSVKRLRILERQFATLKRVAGISAGALLVISLIAFQVYREWKRTAELRQRQVGADVVNGTLAMESGDLSGAMPHFTDALRLDKGNASRETTHRLRIGSVLSHSPKLAGLWEGGERVVDVEFSPDGSKVLLCAVNEQVKIYDVGTGELFAQPFGAKAGSVGGSYSLDGRFIVIANRDGTATVWNAETLTNMFSLPHPSWVFSARFSPDGTRIVTACQDGIARIWNVRTREEEKEKQLRHEGSIRFANFSHDGRLLITASEDGTACIWEASGRLKQILSGHDEWVVHAAFSPDDRKIVTASTDHTARLWEVESGKVTPPFMKHADGVSSADFSPDGRIILTAGADGLADLWDANTLDPFFPAHVLRNGRHAIRASFSPDGRSIVVACSEGPVRLWNFASSATPQVLGRHGSSQNGNRIIRNVSGGFEIRDAALRSAAPVFIPVDLPVASAEFNRNARFVLFRLRREDTPGETNLLLKVCDASSGAKMGGEIVVPDVFTNAVLSDDGQRVVVYGGNISQVWDVQKQTTVAPSFVIKGTISSAFFNPDGTRLVVLAGSELHLWEILSGREVFAPLKHPQEISYAAFNPNGKQLVTCCHDDQRTECAAYLWDAITGKQIGPELRHGDGVEFAFFSPDGKWLVTASQDHTAIVWDLATWRQLAPAMAHTQTVLTAGFSQNARWVVTASIDKTARVWESESGLPVTLPFRAAGYLVNARFVANDSEITAVDGARNGWLWELPVDPRPVEDLIKLAHLLSAGTVILTGELPSSQPESLQEIWQELRSKYPRDFATSPQEIAAWHQSESEKCLTGKQWFAAIFHLEHLLKLHPNDESTVQRLIFAREQLAAKP